MAKINAINNKSEELTIDPGASGDSFVQFDINTTGEWRIGCDDDASDAFKISQGSALGSNDTFIMTANGERTMPLQPAFLAYLGTGDSNVTGDGTYFTIGSGNAMTEIFDQNSDFNTNGTFTAPITGQYLFCAQVELDDITSSHTLGLGVFDSSNGKWRVDRSDFGNIGVTNGMQCGGSVLIDMDAADTCTWDIGVFSSTKTVDTVAVAPATGAGTWFCGYLAV